MLGEVSNALGEQRNLYFCRTGVRAMEPKLFDDLSPSLRLNTHFFSLSLHQHHF
jgi:hypothetical protein